MGKERQGGAGSENTSVTKVPGALDDLLPVDFNQAVDPMHNRVAKDMHRALLRTKRPGQIKGSKTSADGKARDVDKRPPGLGFTVFADPTEPTGTDSQAASAPAPK